MQLFKTMTLRMLATLVLLGSLSTDGSAADNDERFKAFITSFIVPGLAQYRAGATGYATIFMGTELALWGGYYYNTLMKEARREDYIVYAARHAGINPSYDSGVYLGRVGAYDSSFDYNNYMHQRERNPQTYEGDRAWNWDSPSNRDRFLYMRERELDYENYMKYFLAGVALNHFLSGLNAANMVDGRDASAGAMTVTSLGDGLAARYTRSF